MNNYFSKNIKFLRNKKGLKQQELADKLGKNYTTIGKWETGQRSPIMLDVIKVAEFFNVDISKLINENMAITNNNSSIEQVKNNINNLSNKDMNNIGKETLTNMVDYYHEQTKKEKDNKNG